METPQHYNNNNGSLYQFAENHNLNAYEFDILKRVIRCRKKGEFVKDLEKTKFVIDLYINEHLNKLKSHICVSNTFDKIEIKINK